MLISLKKTKKKKQKQKQTTTKQAKTVATFNSPCLRQVEMLSGNCSE